MSRSPCETDAHQPQVNGHLGPIFQLGGTIAQACWLGLSLSRFLVIQDIQGDGTRQTVPCLEAVLVQPRLVLHLGFE